MIFEMQMTHKVIIKTDETDFEKLKQAVSLTPISRDRNIRIIDHKLVNIEIDNAKYLIDLTDAMTDEEIAQCQNNSSTEVSDDAI